MKKLIKKHDIIIPLAALVGAPLCEKFKKDAISTNLGSIKTLCKYATKKNRVIYLTTNSGYGIGEKNKYCDENSTYRHTPTSRLNVNIPTILLKATFYICSCG